MFYLVLAKGPLGSISKVFYTVGEAVVQARSLRERGFKDIQVGEPRGERMTIDQFCHRHGMAEAA
jgi:hypothetical protein